jgi:DNA-binding CsgD family transcriptional regulator
MVREGPPEPESQSIGDVAYAVDRQRSRARKGHGSASEAAWNDLIAGRVRVVSRFDRDGRRFIVARRTENPTQAGVTPLTPRELAAVQHRVRGAQLKDIAPALGVSISTVAKSLQRALFKLGLENQAELVAVLGSAAGPVGRASEPEPGALSEPSSPPPSGTSPRARSRAEKK